MFRSLRTRLPRFGRIPRLCAAGICLLLALGSAAGARRAPGRAADPRSLPVVVAARDLPAGHVLTPKDLRTARWPPTQRPADAHADPRRLEHRRLAGPVSAREPITSGRLLGHDLAAGLPAGLVATPVAVADPHAAELVHAGNRVDLLCTPRPPELTDGTRRPDDAKVRTLVSRARVLAVLPGTEDVGPEIVLATDRETAVSITRAGLNGLFTVVADSP